ncbi:MAG: diguanylate cyclase [Clostridia bacterium]|nr:diguanylate cyclase [Clostridia bacterium]
MKSCASPLRCKLMIMLLIVVVPWTLMVFRDSVDERAALMKQEEERLLELVGRVEAARLGRDMCAPADIVAYGYSYREWLARVLNGMRFPDGMSLVVQDGNGHVVARLPGIGNSAYPPGVKEAFCDHLAAIPAEEGTVILDGLDGSLSLLAYRRLADDHEGDGLWAVLWLPARPVLAKATIAAFRDLFMMLVVAALLIPVAWSVLNKRIVMPINALVDLSQRLGDGDMEVRHGAPYELGEIGTLAHAFDDMAEALKNRSDELTYISYHDMMSKTFNRAYLEKAFRELDVFECLPLSIVIGDINGLKLVNDALGHYAGDALIRRVAGIMKSCAGRRDVVVRWGGDEFVMVLPNTDEECALQMCERIRQACLEADPDPIPPSIALGVATRSSLLETPAAVLKSAETRMYRNKFNDTTSVRGTLISSLRRTLAESTYETDEHSSRMQAYAQALGMQLGLSESDLDDLALLCSLHDIGKVGIPDEVLKKPGPLDPGEWEIMKKHPEIGARIVQGSYELKHISEAVLHHHEKWDGSGYPHGLAGVEIPLASRILSVVDAYDVMVHDRPYKKAMSVDEATAELRRCAGRHFDPLMVELFLGIALPLENDPPTGSAHSEESAVLD